MPLGRIVLDRTTLPLVYITDHDAMMAVAAAFNEEEVYSRFFSKAVFLCPVSLFFVVFLSLGSEDYPPKYYR